MDTGKVVTEVMDQVKRVGELKLELQDLLEEIRVHQQELADEGVLMDFPVLTEGMGNIGLVAVIPATTGAPAETLLSEPVTPAMAEPPSAEELEAEETLANEGDLSRPLPGGEARNATAIRNEAIVAPTQQDVANFQANNEAKASRAITRGFAESEKKGSRFFVGF